VHPGRVEAREAILIQTLDWNILRGGLALSLGLALCGCAAGTVASHETTSSGTQAQESDIVIGGSQPGVTPFIASLELLGQSMPEVLTVTFQIAPKPNTLSQPVNVTWSRAALSGGGYLKSDSISVPVFGLYAGYQNQVTLELGFSDGSVQKLDYSITTDSYADPTGVYTSPTIVKARTAQSTLGFNFFIMKSLLGSPVIVDTDGELRWVVPAEATTSIYFANGQFVSGSETSPVITALQMDGTESEYPAALTQPLFSSFTHNIDPGSTLHGLLAEFNGTDDLGDSIDDIVSDIAPQASDPVLQTFDMADILTSYMQSNGDDPSAFVRPGADWFHVNASTYDPRDNTVIVSSRENFLIKINYETKDVVWILGDPTKYWYTFPSLRAKALTLNAGGDYPIGQHAVSITSDGYIMVFNDGLGSMNQPPGEPAGISRTYSEVTAYTVNTSAMTAQQIFNFNYGQGIFSPICGSSYEAPGHTYLVDFATADNYSQARLVGLDPNLNVVFDFQYESPSDCGAGWNAIPIPLEDLQIN
jgi:arylsulfate sulfotransferase